MKNEAIYYRFGSYIVKNKREIVKKKFLILAEKCA